MRSVELWRGKTDDAAIPPRVRLRVFERYGGRCYVTGRKISPGDHWQLDHIKALCNGGTHSEDNLAPILAGKPHKDKTAVDVAQKSRDRSLKAKHFGALARKPKSRWKRKINGVTVLRDDDERSPRGFGKWQSPISRDDGDRDGT